MKKIYRLLYSNKFVAMVMLLMQIITFVAMYIWISDYSKVLFGLSTVLSAVLIIFEINRTEESTFKMTWITLIAIIPIFGALFYLFTRAQGVSMNIGDDYKNIQEANKKYLVQDNDVMKNIYQTDKNQDGFARYLSKYGGSPAYTNTGVQYYSIGERMFEDMKKNIKNWNDDKEIEQYLSDLLNKKAFDKSGLIYGMGHAVYSLSDPRANVFKSFVESLSKEKGREDEFNLYSRVERLAPQVIASERKMYKGVSANVDFSSGFVYSMLDLPMELYTPMFAIARIAGWSAHRIEELVNPGKIIRPAYKSIAPHKEYVPLDSRD